MQVIHLHTLAVQQKVLTAIHQRSPAEIFTCLGGLKNLYPLVDNVIKSNLVSLNQTKPGLILTWFFIILNTLLHTDPAHIQTMFKSRNLLMTLKHILLTLGHKQMLTVDLINSVKNVIKKNVLARLRFVKVVDSGQYHLTQRYIHTANGTCKAHKAFYETFLCEFIHIIVLDTDLAIQNCYSINPPQLNESKGKGQSSTTHSSNDRGENPVGAAPQIKSSFLIEELSDLIQSITSPPEMKDILKAHQRNGNPLEDAYIDYESLREVISDDKRRLYSALIKLLKLKELQNIKHMALLQKLGKSIADSIIFRADTEGIKNIFNFVQQEYY